MGGVREYWIVDPALERVDFYRLTEDERYARVVPGEDGIYRTENLPGFFLRVADLWRDPLPDVTDRLIELGLVDR